MAARRRQRPSELDDEDAAADEVPQGAGAQEAQGARGRRRDQGAQHHRDDGHDDHHPGVPPQVVRRLGGDDDVVRRAEAAHLDHPRRRRRTRWRSPSPRRHVLVGDKAVVDARERAGARRRCSRAAWCVPLDAGAEEGGREAEVHRRAQPGRAVQPRAVGHRRPARSPTICCSPCCTPPARTSSRTTGSWCSRRASPARARSGRPQSRSAVECRQAGQCVGRPQLQRPRSASRIVGSGRPQSSAAAAVEVRGGVSSSGPSSASSGRPQSRSAVECRRAGHRRRGQGGRTTVLVRRRHHMP